jgi:polyisoprenoid-binding protein YceI
MARMDVRRILRRPLTWIIAIPVVLALAVTVGPWVYINFIKSDAPARLSFEDVPSATSATSAPTSSSGAGGATTTTDGSASADPSTLDGAWQVTSGSQVGYRVTEVLFGQDTEGVGRTSTVTGTMQLQGTTVTAATFQVDMTTFKSDESRRDSQFDGRIMDVRTYPTSTFTLTSPIQLTSIPDNLVEVGTKASGDLTLRGTTKPVEIDLVARRNGDKIEVTGSLDVKFADWGIPNPSNGPVTTQDHGSLELLLVFERSTA